MDAVKKKVLESLGFIVATESEYRHLTQAESEFRRRLLEKAEEFSFDQTPQAFINDSSQSLTGEASYAR